MTEQIERIKIKLADLKEKDEHFQVFGASKHRYQLRPVIQEEELKIFEEKYAIQLPAGYRNFLLLVGNGGAGPYYGLEPFQHGIYASLDYKEENDLINPSKEFVPTEPWNLSFDNTDEENIEQREIEYFDNKWVNGLLRICNFGCGVYMNIVVKGREYGHIWVDDRCSDGGIYPDPYFGNKDRTGFLDWYELWLNKSLIEIQNKPKSAPELKPPPFVVDPPKRKPSWWRRLLGIKASQ